MRTGSWVGRSRRQIVQVAVPEDLPPEEVDGFLSSSLLQAVELAAGHLATRRPGTSTAGAEAVARRVCAEYGSGP